MKHILSIIAILFLTMTCTACFAESDEEVALTTENEILFSNIPWGCDYKTFEDILIKQGAKFTSEHEVLGDGKKYSYSFGISGFSGANYSDVKTDYYTLKNTEQKKSPWGDMYTQYNPVINVAGYQVYMITACFFADTDELYTIRIEMSKTTKNGESVSASSMFDDMNRKLTSIYGTPYQDSFESRGTLGGKDTIITYAWLGGEKTGLELAWSSTKGSLRGALDKDSITLIYGRTDSDEAMRLRREKQQGAQVDKEQQAIDAVADDMSGL